MVLQCETPSTTLPVPLKICMPLIPLQSEHGQFFTISTLFPLYKMSPVRGILLIKASNLDARKFTPHKIALS